jgi:DivIVA domain-containing protein
MTDEDLLPLSEEVEPAGFDLVMRGYHRGQVEDYVARVEVALVEADRQHVEDGERLTALAADVAALQSRLADAEQRAAGLPEASSRLTERMATMLRLAEEEAEQIVGQAQDRADSAMAERTAHLDRREADIAGAGAEADQMRLDAQRDAEAVRARTAQEAQATMADARHQAESALAQARAEVDELVRSAHEQADSRTRTAEEDIAILHQDARVQHDQMLAEAQREVEQMRAQRDRISEQLQSLRETLSAAVQPLQPPRD